MKTHQRIASLVLLFSFVLTASSFAQQRERPDFEQMDITKDIAYAATDNPRQCLDLYLPRVRDDEEPLPVLVYIHGGAWRAGDKRGGGFRLARFVAEGKYAGISVGYRLTGEAKWPAQLHDCKAAIRWIRANAEKHNLDAEKIAVWGTSAGGHLVSCLGTMNDDEALEGDLGEHDDQSSRVACVINYYGPSNLLTMDDHKSQIRHNAPNSPESLLIGGPIQQNKEKTRTACSLFYVTKDDAPHLIVHGTNDRLVPYPQSEVFDKALDDAGVPSTLIKMDGGGHGFRSEELDRRVEKFLAKHLQGKEADISDQPIKVEPRRR